MSRSAARHPTAPWIFLAPIIVLYLVFAAYPLVRTAVLCFYESVGPSHHVFVGLANFRFVVRDPLFWIALLNTTLYSVVFLILYIPLALGLALLLNHSAILGRRLVRAAFFSTYLVGQVFVTFIFSLLMTPRHGLLNRAIGAVLPRVGPDLDWRNNPLLSLPALISLSLWLSVGFGMVYLLAALQSLDEQLFAAAAVDGAGRLRRFWHITLPGLRPALGLLLLAGTINSFQLFELPYLFFNGPGPAFTGLTIVMYLYQQGFELGNVGYAATIGWMLTMLLLAVISLQLLIGRRIAGSSDV